MQLIIKAKHFNGADFSQPCGCPLSKAAREQFDEPYCNEAVHSIIIGETNYDHKKYGKQEFNDDIIIASNNHFDDTIIRTITLTPCA